MSSNQPILTMADVFALLERAVKNAGSARAYARRVGVSYSYLSDVRNARVNIPPVILHDLGVYPTRTYGVRTERVDEVLGHLGAMKMSADASREKVLEGLAIVQERRAI